jgi:small conductance mechanosensitive channel
MARTTTRPIKQWCVGREFNRRLKKKFDQLGIEIPFPHVTLYMGENKAGQSRPIHIVSEQAAKEWTHINTSAALDGY